MLADQAVELVDATAFHLGDADRLGGLFVEGVPTILPRLQGLFGGLPVFPGGFFPGSRLFQFRLVLFQKQTQRLPLRRVRGQVFVDLAQGPFRLLQLPGLAPAQFPGVLDGLFQTGNLRAHFVVAGLHLIETLPDLSLSLAGLFQFQLHAALLSHGGFQFGLDGVQGGPLPFAAAIQVLDAHGQQTGLGFALLLFEFLVLFGRPGLTFQMIQLFLNFFPQVIES